MRHELDDHMEKEQNVPRPLSRAYIQIVSISRKRRKLSAMIKHMQEIERLELHATDLQTHKILIRH